MRRISLIIINFILFAVIILTLFGGGCQERSVTTGAFTTTDGKNLFLAEQKSSIDTGDKKFTLSCSSDGKAKNWTSPYELLGELASLISGEQNFTAVFTSGSVLRFSYKDGAFSSERLTALPGKIIDADGISTDTPENIIALCPATTGLQLKLYNGEEWKDYGPELKLMHSVLSARICVLNQETYLAWRELPESGAITGELSLAKLSGNKWEYISAPSINAVKNLWQLFVHDNHVVAAAYPKGIQIMQGGPKLRLFELDGGIWNPVKTTEIFPEFTRGFSHLDANSTAVGILCALGDDQTAKALFLDKKFNLVTKPDFSDSENTFSGMNLELLLFWILFGFLVFSIVRSMRFRREMLRKAKGKAGNGEAPSIHFPAAENNPIRNFLPPEVGPGGIASPIERALALFIDYILLLPLPLAFVFASDSGIFELVSMGAQQDILAESIQRRLLPAGLFYQIAFLIYAIVMENRFGQTVGKKLLGIKVRATSGGKASPAQILLRNVMRIIDMPLFGFNFMFLPAIISMLFSRTNQRIGDRVGKTIVARRVPIFLRDIVLASSSPRRRKLLNDMGFGFRIISPEVSEITPYGATPEQAALVIAQRKAEEVGAKLLAGEIVIAADTVIAIDNKIIGKPRDRDHAREILSELSGKTHRVITGLAIWDRACNRRVSALEITSVEMKTLSAEQIEEYVNSGESDGKAGAYAIQENGHKLIAHVEGSRSNVIGLPTETLGRILVDMET